MLGLVNYDSSSSQESNEQNKIESPHIASITDQSASHELDPITVERIKHYYDLKIKTGFDLTENIRGKKEFGNPQILQKVIDHYHIYQAS